MLSVWPLISRCLSGSFSCSPLGILLETLFSQVTLSSPPTADIRLNPGSHTHSWATHCSLGGLFTLKLGFASVSQLADYCAGDGSTMMRKCFSFAVFVPNSFLRPSAFPSRQPRGCPPIWQLGLWCPLWIPATLRGFLDIAGCGLGRVPRL